MKRIKLIIIISAFCYLHSFGAYLRDVPITITQPDGTKIECFATGDEYYNWVHDKDGYTIIQDKKTGYYCYAILVGDDLVASQYVVGVISPKSVNIEPNINISGEKILERVNEFIQNTPQKGILQKSGTQSRGGTTDMLNNIVIYIRFADQTEFPAEQSQYTSMFNGIDSGNASMRNYFREVSYDQLDIMSHFYPINDSTVILSYQDSNNRDYYCPYHAITNPLGYTDQRRQREDTLIYNAINFIKNQIPSSLNIDFNNDGYVDNIYFIVRGYSSGWNDLLWPRAGRLWSEFVDINGKTVRSYNFDTESGGAYNSSVICHEMGHILGFPDLAHYNGDMVPVGRWDVMSSQSVPPQHMGAYMKYKYGGWIPSIPSITTSGTYTLQPLTSSTNNCYKIPISGLDSSQYYIVFEYRKKTGVFESGIPGSGLIIYRINEGIQGNGQGYAAGGLSDEVYVFRPDGTMNPPSDGDIDNAYFSETSGRTTFSNSTNPYCFDINDDKVNIYIKNIRENTNGTLSFDIRFCDDENITYSNTSNLPSLSNASNSIQTSGTVIVKSMDNITFEAGNEITLNPGFEIQLGGTFEINMNECGENSQP